MECYIFLLILNRWDSQSLQYTTSRKTLVIFVSKFSTEFEFEVSCGPEFSAILMGKKLANSLTLHKSAQLFFPGKKPDPENPGNILIWNILFFGQILRLDCIIFCFVDKCRIFTNFVIFNINIFLAMSIEYKFVIKPPHQYFLDNLALSKSKNSKKNFSMKCFAPVWRDVQMKPFLGN